MKSNRREFLGRSTVALAGLSLAKHVKQPSSDDRLSLSQRRLFPLNRRWLYKGSVASDSYLPDYDDQGFERVTIPHTNRILPWNGFDDKSYQFISIYRRHFKLPNELRERRVLVDFGGVMTAASVWLNGQRLGDHRGGYTPFT